MGQYATNIRYLSSTLVYIIYFFKLTLALLVNIVYNSTMDKFQESYLESFINLKGLLSQKVNRDSKADFLTFVKLMAPSLVSDFRMGSHIKVISNKLKELEDGEVKRLMVFPPPRS